MSLLIPDINCDLRHAVSKKSPRGKEVSKRPFFQHNEGSRKIMIPREAKRIHRLISIHTSECLLVSFGLNTMIESFDFTIKAFDELNCEFGSSSELVVIGFPGFEQKVRFLVWMRRPVSYVLPVSRDIPAKMFRVDFHRQKWFEFRLQIRTKINTGTVSPSVIQVQTADVRKAFDINLNATTNVPLAGDGACEVPHVCLDHMHDQRQQIHGEPKSSVTEFVEKSSPVLFIARCKIFTKSYRRGINWAWLAYIRELWFISDNQAAKSLQFVVLSAQGDAKRRPRTGKEFSSAGTGGKPMIGGVKGTNIWFPVSDHHVVRPFSVIQNVVWRTDKTERQVIRFVERVLGIAARATSIARLVADARKSVSSGHFGLCAMVIAVGKFPSSLSSEVIRSVQLFPECSEFLRTGTYSTPLPGCPVIAAHRTNMGLWELHQGQCERQRANDFCFFLPPAAD
jgi:hypothetical protein